MGRARPRGVRGLQRRAGQPIGSFDKSAKFPLRSAMQIAILSAVFVAVISAGSAAFAQTAEFKCPDKGTIFITRSDGADDQSVATGQEGDACTSQRTSGGKAMVLREHWGLVGSVDAAGESYVRGLDLKLLWPLKVGNKINQTVNGIGYDGKPYTTTVAITVAAYEKITVPAGTFDAFRVEERKADDSAPRTRGGRPRSPRRSSRASPTGRIAAASRSTSPCSDQEIAGRTPLRRRSPRRRARSGTADDAPPGTLPPAPRPRPRGDRSGQCPTAKPTSPSPRRPRPRSPPRSRRIVHQLDAVRSGPATTAPALQPP